MIKLDKIEERFPRQNRFGRSVMQEISPRSGILKSDFPASPPTGNALVLWCIGRLVTPAKIR